MVRSLAVIVLLICAAGALAPARAQAQEGTTLTPKQRERERKAMSAYAATRYQEALDLYADLYADFHDPLYLRNIGRCHQKLKHPEEAIASFEEYLSKYKRLSGAEIDEVKGWIEEMKELQVEQHKASTPPPPPVATPAPSPEPAPTPVSPPPPLVAPPPVVVEQAAPRERGNGTIRRVGWGLLIAGAALAVTGGVFDVLSWTRYNSASGNKCLSNNSCEKAADDIDQRARLSKIFFLGGAAAGLTGGALIYFFPVREPARTSGMSGMGAGAAWTF